MNKLLTLTLSAAFLAGAPAFAADHAKGHKMNMSGDAMHKMDKMSKMQDTKTMVKSPWARASISRNGAAYFTVANMGKTDVKVVAVSADVAKRVELHTHIQDGEIMRMRHVKSIPVPAGGSVVLKPGGYHVMLMGLTRKLKEGETFPLTVAFDNGTKTQVTVKIGKMGGMTHMGAQSGHQMDKMKGDMKKMDAHGHSHGNMKH